MSDQKRPLLALTRPEIYRPTVLAALSEFCHLCADTPCTRRVADAVWVDPLFPRDTQLEIEQYRRLRYVLSNTTDTAHVDPLCTHHGIEPISLQGMDLREVHSTGDYTALLVQLALRPLSREGEPGGLVAGKRVVILGEHRGRPGRVATHLAHRLRDLAAMVTICAPASIYRLAPAADVLSVNLPARPEYHHVIDRVAVSALKAGAVLVNTARDRLVDDAAVLSALDSGRLARYAADFRPRGPLADHPRVIWSDHVAGYTWEDLGRTQMMIATAFRQRLAAEKNATS